MENGSCSPFNLFYWQYHFEGGEKGISFSCTHGNSKRDEPFKATTYSVRKEIKCLASKEKKGKEIIQCLTQSAGGFSEARTVAELPNSLNQIYNLSRKNNMKDRQNELLELIDMCNIQYGLPNAFLREVRTAPELSTFLANDRQLQDIEKYCQSNSLVIDSTCNICNYVIICTYKNPLLEVTGADRTPVMIGPAIAHAQKTFESYFTLPHNMLRHNWNIAQLKRFKTDAEVNVFQAFKACFPNADHLLCWIHSKDNVKRKLADLKLRFSGSYINEILGEKSGNMKVKGLLDSKSQEEYESEWKRLKKIWLNREKGSDKFVSYLQKHKKQKWLESMVHFV